MPADQSHDDSRASDLAVMDAQEYKQKRRLERILDAHDNVEEVADAAWDLYITGEISHDAKNIMIQRAVQKAIREVYKLLIDHKRANGDDANRYWDGEPQEPLGEIPFETQEDRVVTGLDEFMRLSLTYSETWTETHEREFRPPSTTEHEVTHTVPEELSWQAFLRLKEFLDDEHDLELQFEAMNDDDLPMIRDFDQSGENGTAESGTAKYEGDPDL